MFRKGDIPWNKGLTAESDVRVKKYVASRKGYRHTEESKEKNRQSHLGKKDSDETRRKQSEVKRGKKNSYWKGGVSSLENMIRSLPEYNNWRMTIFKRDNFTCQDCGEKGIRLHAHHFPVRFIELFKQFLQEYNQFSPIEDKEILVELAKKYESFWVAKGITLCKKCHDKRHKRKIEEF